MGFGMPRSKGADGRRPAKDDANVSAIEQRQAVAHVISAAVNRQIYAYQERKLQL